MVTKKPTFLDEFLKRWPLYMLGVGSMATGVRLYYSLQENQIRMEAKIDKIIVLTDKDKEAINLRFETLEASGMKTENKANETEKDVIRILAVLPAQIKIKE